MAVFSHGDRNNNFAVTTEAGRAWKLLRMQDVGSYYLSFPHILFSAFTLFLVFYLFAFFFFLNSQPKPSPSQCCSCQWDSQRQNLLLLEACQVWYCVIRSCAPAVSPPVSLQMKVGTETVFSTLTEVFCLFYVFLLRKYHWNRSAMAPDYFNSFCLFPN